MTEHTRTSRKWIVPMLPRSPSESHRASTPLELFFDLVFVVAVAQAGVALHHELAEGHFVQAIINYFAIFFAIWWAWMNFTWFASAYDCDDLPYRLATFVQITGALIMAAGIQQAFKYTDYRIIVVGYVVMRLGMVTQYLRAGLSNPSRRATAFRYTLGVTVCQFAWAALTLFQGMWWHPFVFVGLGLIELLVPAWGERAGATAWHPGHITERYGLFTIIVLGESILAASLGIQSAIDTGGFSKDLITTILGGLLIIFSMWWVYFESSTSHMLTTLKKAFMWGYGHLFIFASIAAVGAGLAVQVDFALHHSEITPISSGMTVAIPTVIYIFTLWLLHAQSQPAPRQQRYLAPIVSLFILLTPFAQVHAALLIGILLVTTIAIKLVVSQKEIPH